MDAPVDEMPITNDRENEQKYSNQKETGGFGRVGVVMRMTRLGCGFFMGDIHENHCIPACKRV